MNIWDYSYWVIFVVYVLMIVAIIYTVLHERRDPVRAVSWIAVLVLIPIGGLIVYLFFGQNFRKQKIFNRKENKDLRQMEEFSRKQIFEIDEIHTPEVDHNRHIIKLLLNNSKSLLTFNNTIRVLKNGTQTFDCIIEELRKAHSTIHLEYYIFEDDDIGNSIAQILIERARVGVEVRLIYDDVGSWNLGRDLINSMRRAGVKVHCFMPVVFPWFTSKINYRNHRKIIVIDGRIGFTGGLNIADRYIKGTKRGIWRDTHLRIEGEAVRMLQITFLTDWYFAAKELLRDRTRYFPKFSTANLSHCALQIAVSGPDSDYATIMQAYFSAITKAKHHIFISTPYFLPNEPILTALKVAALSGVDVRILMPSRSDSKMVHWASRSYFTELLEAKIKIYLFTQGFNHSKIMTIDGTFSSVGTANMDVRSFEDNFEITAMIYDKATTTILETQMLDDFASSEAVTLKNWQQRKHKDNFKESVARLFSPLL